MVIALVIGSSLTHIARELLVLPGCKLGNPVILPACRWRHRSHLCYRGVDEHEPDPANKVKPYEPRRATADETDDINAGLHIKRLSRTNHIVKVF